MCLNFNQCDSTIWVGEHQIGDVKRSTQSLKLRLPIFISLIEWDWTFDYVHPYVVFGGIPVVIINSCDKVKLHVK